MAKKLCAKCATCDGTRLGDLTPQERAQIQRVVEDVQRQIDAEFGPGAATAEVTVVGSAARGERRNVGSDLPIGHDPPGAPGTTRSDIDYVVPRAQEDFYRGGFATAPESLPQRSLPGFHDFQGAPFSGDPEPGPAITFRAGQEPTYSIVPEPAAAAPVEATPAVRPQASEPVVRAPAGEPPTAPMMGARVFNGLGRMLGPLGGILLFNDVWHFMNDPPPPPPEA